MLARAAAAASMVAFLGACGGEAATAPPPRVQETVIGAGPHRTLAELEREFVSSCTGKVPDAPDYCACAWEQMARTFSEEEMNSPIEDRAKQSLLKDRIETRCARKLAAPR